MKIGVIGENLYISIKDPHNMVEGPGTEACVFVNTGAYKGREDGLIVCGSPKKHDAWFGGPLMTVFEIDDKVITTALHNVLLRLTRTGRVKKIT